MRRDIFLSNCWSCRCLSFVLFKQCIYAQESDRHCLLFSHKLYLESLTGLNRSVIWKYTMLCTGLGVY